MAINRRHICGAAAIVSIVLVSATVFPILRTPDIMSADFRALAAECQEIVGKHNANEHVAVRQYPEIDRLRPVEVVVRDESVLLKLSNRIGVQCLRENDVWIIELTGDVDGRQLAKIPVEQLCDSESSNRASSK